MQAAASCAWKQIKFTEVFEVGYAENNSLPKPRAPSLNLQKYVWDDRKLYRWPVEVMTKRNGNPNKWNRVALQHEESPEQHRLHVSV